jgi:hypothetical protein
MRSSIIRRLWNRIALSPRYLGWLSILLLMGMLIACLWPFYRPQNAASWIEGGGVTFDQHSVLLSSDALIVPGNRESVSCSFELWLVPGFARNMGTILAIYSPKNPRQFVVDQWRTGLAVRAASVGDPLRTGTAPSYTHDVLKPGKAVFVTVTSGQPGTQVYIDGILRKTSPHFFITNRMLSGKLVLGTAASADSTWLGRLRGLAIYDRTLDPAEIREHYVTWTGSGRPEVSDPEALLALFLFKERSFRNEVAGGTGLYLPQRYVIPAKSVLSAPSLENPQDIIENIIGFIPLGFTLCGYIVTSRRMRMPVVITILLCGVLSLLIETLQIFLPTRDSDLTDVITNVIGSAIGALAYQWGASRWSARPAPVAGKVTVV